MRDELAEAQAELEVGGDPAGLRDELLEAQAELDVSQMEEDRLQQAVMELESKLDMVLEESARRGTDLEGWLEEAWAEQEDA